MHPEGTHHAPRSHDVLTPRQWEIVRLLCEGRCPEEIGEKLGISYQTVRQTMHHARERMGVAGNDSHWWWCKVAYQLGRLDERTGRPE